MCFTVAFQIWFVCVWCFDFDGNKLSRKIKQTICSHHLNIITDFVLVLLKLRNRTTRLSTINIWYLISFLRKSPVELWSFKCFRFGIYLHQAWTFWSVSGLGLLMLGYGGGLLLVQRYYVCCVERAWWGRWFTPQRCSRWLNLCRFDIGQ